MPHCTLLPKNISTWRLSSPSLYYNRMSCTLKCNSSSEVRVPWTFLLDLETQAPWQIFPTAFCRSSAQCRLPPARRPVLSTPLKVSSPSSEHLVAPGVCCLVSQLFVFTFVPLFDYWDFRKGMQNDFQNIRAHLLVHILLHRVCSYHSTSQSTNHDWPSTPAREKALQNQTHKDNNLLIHRTYSLEDKCLLLNEHIWWGHKHHKCKITVHLELGY